MPYMRDPRWKTHPPDSHSGESSLDHPGTQFQAQCVRQLENRGKARIAFAGKRPVQTLAPQPSVFGQLRHAAGASDGA